MPAAAGGGRTHPLSRDLTSTLRRACYIFAQDARLFVNPPRNALVTFSIPYLSFPLAFSPFLETPCSGPSDRKLSISPIESMKSGILASRRSSRGNFSPHPEILPRLFRAGKGAKDFSRGHREPFRAAWSRRALSGKAGG